MGQTLTPQPLWSNERDNLRWYMRSCQTRPRSRSTEALKKQKRWVTITTRLRYRILFRTAIHKSITVQSINEELVPQTSTLAYIRTVFHAHPQPRLHMPTSTSTYTLSRYYDIFARASSGTTIRAHAYSHLHGINLHTQIHP